MKKQVITWTAIPNGPRKGPIAPGAPLRVSVFISPRLQENGTPTLHDFPDWLNWPKTLAHVKFEVQFGGGSTVQAHIVSPKPDFEHWRALFNDKTPITPFNFENRTNQFVRSYPLSRLQSDIHSRYQTIIQGLVKNPGSLPNIRTLYEAFGQIAPRQFARDVYIAPLDNLIDGVLKTHKAIPPVMANIPAVQSQPGGVAGDYHQVDQFMHRKTLQPITADPATHPPKPKKSDLYDLFDFHKMISALGSYPELLVKLGLVVELEIPYQPSIPGSSTISLITSLFNAAPNVHPRTHYLLDMSNGFRAMPNGGSYLTNELLLKLSDKSTFDITTMDIGGTAVKLLGMVANVNEQVSRPIAGLSPDQGVPTLRTAGISLIHTGRAYDLVQRFQTAHTQNTKAETNVPVDLFADDLVRGYAIDIWQKLTNKWHSLSLRNGTFFFKYASPAHQTLHTKGEGYVGMATSQVPGGPSDLYLHEQVFGWHGWSLAAPRPVTPIDTGDSGKAGDTGEQPADPTDIQNPDITRYGLTVDFKVPPGTLPKLRFGQFYEARARMVDVAGNVIDPEAPGALLPAVKTASIYYSRWEPIIAPSITLRHSIKGSPGESTARLVIRSDYNRSTDQYFADQSSPTYNKDAERHFLPSKTSEMMAETHSMFDSPPPAGKTWYQVITETDVSLPLDANPPHDPLPQNTDSLPLPYTPDPLSEGATFVGLPGVPAGKPFTDPTWGGQWPYLGTFRLLLKGIGATAIPQPPNWSTSPHPLLTVELPKGEMVTVRYSSRPVANALALMAAWDMVIQTGLQNVFLKYAQDGLAWLLTPYHEITLVHAVQRPLIKPRFSHVLQGVRQTGDTSAVLVDEPMPISGRSTIKLDIEANWFEPNDDVTQPEPTILAHKGHVSEIPLNYVDKKLIFPPANPANMGPDKSFFTHEFSNTKYHRVAYTAVGTTRYREYFPFTKADLATKPDLITRSSDTGAVTKPDPVNPKATSIVDAAHPLPFGVIDVPSSARPLAPILQYIMPIFAHETAALSDGVSTVRRGGGLRVYLERPWFSSGEGELLGVVLPPVNNRRVRRGILSHILRSPDPSHFTQWGLDPIWDSRNAPTPISPTLALFTNAVRTGNGLSIDEQPGTAVSVAGHEVSYDADRRLWYSDVALSGGFAYYPFVRFVLARYQPNSIANAHLSRLVLADFSQIAPNRSATVVFDTKDPRQMRITVAGPAPYRTTNLVQVSLEQQALGANGGDPDLGWIPVDNGQLTLHLSIPVGKVRSRILNEAIWTGEYRLPTLPTPVPPLRLVVREFEIYQVIPSKDTIQVTIATIPTARRLVYAEILDVLIPG